MVPQRNLPTLVQPRSGNTGIISAFNSTPVYNDENLSTPSNRKSR